MVMQPAIKVFTLVTLSVLVVYHTSKDNACCQAALSPLTDPKKDGYSRLIRDIKAHPIAKEKIPPKVTLPMAVNTAGSQKQNDDNNKSVNVVFQLMPVDILGLDPAKQALEMSGYISLYWFDKDLTWNSSEYGGVQLIELPSTLLWTPTLSLLNGVDGNDLLTDDRVPLFLYPDGMVFLVFKVNTKTSCKLDLMFFPFDEVSCEIIIITMAQDRVSLITSERTDFSSLLADLSVGGEWLLTDFTMEAIVIIELRASVTDIKITLKLCRKTTFYLVSVVGPMALFTAMNCLVFLIPPQSGEKVSFLVSIFISNAVFSSFINQVMPRGLEKQVNNYSVCVCACVRACMGACVCLCV